MLTYWRVRSAFESICALLSNLIWGSETTSQVIKLVLSKQSLNALKTTNHSSNAVLIKYGKRL